MALKPDLTVPVLGLNVDSNPLVRPRGSLSVADNIVLRHAGKAEPAMAPVAVSSGDDPRLANFTPDASTYGVRVFCQGDENVLAIERASAGAANVAGTKLRTSDDPTNEVSTVGIGTGTRNLSFDNQRTQHAYSDGRHFLTSDSGVLALDGLETSSNQTLRLAGLVAPAEIRTARQNSFAGAPAVLPIDGYVAYKAIYRRKVGNEYALYGPPTRAVIQVGTVAATAVQVTVLLGTQDGVTAGDEVVVYKTSSAVSAAEIVENYRETMVHTLTSAEVTALTFSAWDQTLDSGLDGAELYINAGQDGPTNPNYPPPLSADVCPYNSAALYVNAGTWPALKLQPGGAYGTLSSATDRTDGIGIRVVTGTRAGTTNVFTGVSAADRVGLEVGQFVCVVGSTGDRYITSIVLNGATYDVTVSSNFAVYVPGPGSTTYYVADSAVLTFLDSAGATVTSARVPIAPRVTASFGFTDPALAALSVRGVRLLTDIPMDDLTASTVTAPELAFTGLDAGAFVSIQATDITNGQNYANTTYTGSAYTASSIQDTRENLVWFSKLQQPEAVSPLANFVVGAERALRVTKVGSVALGWCTDGLYAIQGDAANGFTSQQLDPKCVLYHPSAVAVLGNAAYAMTYSGVVRADESGIQNISKDAVNTLIQDQFGNWPDTWYFAACADPVNNEVRFSLPGGDTLVFNATTQQWATRTDDMIHGCFDRGVDAVGRRTPDVIITTSTGYFCDSDHCAATELRHNPVSPEAPTVVSQYVDTCLMFEEDLVPTVGITFDGTVSRSVTPSASNTAHELQCRVPRRAARKPRLTVGFTTAVGTAGVEPLTWSYSGYGVRYRSASGKVKR
jgi:hypothetical protein